MPVTLTRILVHLHTMSLLCQRGQEVWKNTVLRAHEEWISVQSGKESKDPAEDTKDSLEAGDGPVFVMTQVEIEDDHESQENSASADSIVDSDIDLKIVNPEHEWVYNDPPSWMVCLI